ncbi:serine/arginine repetitive matrix protein 2-like isoform X2 [Daphnia carinata]|uniref:serine/arginine repetitive matrix protein 2-like isoform X2 n=1 Tax=Daphnia carinata TaxID=120202 RepID=UPI00257D7B8F|nr:serine/arginine repetitive matrix protein 2-like isoform X2 [Daphnia carinata]
MGSPRRAQRDQDNRVDIKDRLQALAKASTRTKKSTTSTSERTAPKSQNNSQSGRDHGKNNKSANRKDSMERVMERARTEGGNRWTKKLLDEEAKDPDRWGHSGFKEMYKNELGISRNRRSRSRQKAVLRRSKSRDRVHKSESGRRTSDRERSDGGGHRKTARPQVKRSFSSSDRSPNSDVKRRSDSSKRPINGALHERKSVAEKSVKTNANRVSKLEINKKPIDRRREPEPRRDRFVKKGSPLRSRSRSPARYSEKATITPKRHTVNAGSKAKISTRRGPVSPPERGRSHSGSPGRSSASPIRRRQMRLSDDGSSCSSSSLSHSSFSRSSSSSSSTSGSSTSSSSKETSYRKGSALKPRSPPGPPRLKAKEQFKPGEERQATKQSFVSKSAKRPIAGSSIVASPLKKRRTARRDTDSSSNESSSGTDDEDVEDGEEEEEGEDVTEGPNTATEPQSSNVSSRLSLSERFGKLAQLSSQRRNLELVQLRIVAPVGGAATTEKNVSIDESSAAPVISNAKAAREHSVEPLPQAHVSHHAHHHHQIKNIPPPEEPIRKDERAREDRWRDWHERYDQYRHVQPPRQLPRDWDDIRVRHKYYTDRGYFGHDMTLEELSRWEAWWHRYQLWRRGYEHAWVKTHGPHVPIEYPDWTNYRSTNSRREVAQPVSTSSSIRSRLGWRR